MTSRRTLLKSGAGLALVTALGLPDIAQSAQSGLGFIIDGRLAGADNLLRLADGGGHRVYQPQGEVVRLLLGAEGRDLLGQGMIVGLTGYVDAMLAADVLRGLGRRVRSVDAIGPATPADQRFFASLRRSCGAATNEFFWVA